MSPGDGRDEMRPPEEGLERELRELGRRVEYPPTPRISQAVRDRLESETSGRSSRGQGGGARSGEQEALVRWAVAAVLVLVIGLPILAGALQGGMGFGGAGGAASGGGQAAPGAGAARQGAGGAEGAGGAAPEGADEAGVGSEACAPPRPVLSVEPERAAPGEEVVVRGERFYGYGEGPAAGCPNRVPLRDVRLVFVQDGSERVLGAVDSDEEYSFSGRVRVPEGAAPGRAFVRAEGGGLDLRPSEEIFIAP